MPLRCCSHRFRIVLKLVVILVPFQELWVLISSESFVNCNVSGAGGGEESAVSERRSRLAYTEQKRSGCRKGPSPNFLEWFWERLHLCGKHGG